MRVEAKLLLRSRGHRTAHDPAHEISRLLRRTLRSLERRNHRI
jgi:hypothetical protein